KRHASRGECRHPVGCLEASVSLEEKERRRHGVESFFGAFEEIEPAISIEVEPQRRTRTAWSIRNACRLSDLFEMIATVHEQALELGANAALSARQLNEVLMPVIVDVGPCRAVLVAPEIRGREPLLGDVGKAAMPEVAIQSRSIEMVRRVKVRQAVPVEVAPCDTMCDANVGDP